MTPFRAIVGIDALGLSNQTFAIVMALSAAGSALASVVLGWLSDRTSDRRVLVALCAVIGVLAYGILWLVQTPLAFIVAFCVLVPFGAALFSQSFAFSRAYYDRHSPDRSEFLMSLLRSGFTLAWILFPPFAGWIASQFAAFSVFGVSMIAHALATLAVGLLWTQEDTNLGALEGEQSTATGPIRLARTFWFGIPAVVLAQVAIQINLTVLPLIIIRDLAGNLQQVGLNAAFAAVLEVPVMIAWGVLAIRLKKDIILSLAVAIFAVYFVGMSFVGSFAHVLALQIPAAIAIAALLSINISYLQSVFSGRVGLSTSLLDVTTVVSAVLAASLFALFATESYKPMMPVAVVICCLSLCLFGIAHLTVKSEQSQKV